MRRERIERAQERWMLRRCRWGRAVSISLEPLSGPAVWVLAQLARRGFSVRREDQGRTLFVCGETPEAVAKLQRTSLWRHLEQHHADIGDVIEFWEAQEPPELWS